MDWNLPDGCTEADAWDALDPEDEPDDSGLADDWYDEVREREFLERIEKEK